MYIRSFQKMAAGKLNRMEFYTLDDSNPMNQKYVRMSSDEMLTKDALGKAILECWTWQTETDIKNIPRHIYFSSGEESKIVTFAKWLEENTGVEIVRD